MVIDQKPLKEFNFRSYRSSIPPPSPLHFPHEAQTKELHNYKVPTGPEPRIGSTRLPSPERRKKTAYYRVSNIIALKPD